MTARKRGLIRSLTNRGGDDEIAVGQRFQKQGVPWVIWEVSSLFEGTDGMPYVQMMRVDDRTNRKTVSRTVLERETDYVRLRV